ncbi:MAG: 4Fe-4S ferredoxin [Thermoprotei archaeon]|nr:MAG: 4Fe-4S ferredoxin [Thermoprotei archaeon]RLF25872.1 MAG: 4Fe-4S ferredoxin [Thermoprotei archaeon]
MSSQETFHESHGNITCSLRRLIDVNVCTRELRRNPRLLIYGKCVAEEYPEIFKQFAKDRVALAVCLEAEHMNMVGFKLASMAARLDLKEIVVLTVDGSPHCVQLHMMVEEVNKFFSNRLNIKHIVIEEGRIVEIDSKCVKVARYLSRIQKLILRQST